MPNFRNIEKDRKSSELWQKDYLGRSPLQQFSQQYNWSLVTMRSSLAQLLATRRGRAAKYYDPQVLGRLDGVLTMLEETERLFSHGYREARDRFVKDGMGASSSPMELTPNWQSPSPRESTEDCSPSRDSPPQ